MKVVFSILGGLVGLLILLTLGAWIFLSREVVVERSLVIPAPQALVFEQVNNLKQWELWSPWHKIDPKMELTYGDKTVGTGASYSWKSKHEQVGNGIFTIITSQPSDSIHGTMDFLENGKGQAYYKFSPAESGTKVTWSMKSDLGGFPLIWYMGGMLKDMIGKDFDKGLNNLSHVSDSIAKLQPVASTTGEAANITYEVKEENVAQRNVFVVRMKSKLAEISQNMGMAYGGIQKTFEEQQLKMTGYPFAIYYNDGKDGTFDFAPGLAYTGKGAKEVGNVKPVTLPASKVAVTEFYGPYEQTGKAHDAIQAWVKANNKTITGSPWEEYITDPMTEKDPNKWLTKVYYPIK